MGWLADFRADLDAYAALGASRGQAASSREVWAILQYRVAHQYRHQPLLRPLLAAWRLVVEMGTNISIGSAAQIGPGLHISHAGVIVISGDAVIGSHCYITHGLTIGVNGTGDRRGVPTLGDGVYIGPNAVLVGPIKIGDSAMIGANCVVWQDVPARTRVRPAAPSFIADRDEGGGSGGPTP